MLCYQNFNLLMDRSLKFRVYPHWLLALFELAFAAAPPLQQINLASEE